MAIARDTSATADFGGGGGSPQSYSYTVTGSDPILVAAIRIDGNQTITSCSWNTTETMTQVGVVNVDGSVRLYLFMLAAPTTGTHNVTVVFSAAANLRHFTASYTGASATGQPDASKSDQQTADPVTVNLTTVAANCWIVGISRDIGADTLTVTSGATVLLSEGTHTRFYDTNGPVSAGSNSVTIDHPGSSQLSTAIASFAPFVAAGLTVVGRAVFDYVDE